MNIKRIVLYAVFTFFTYYIALVAHAGMQSRPIIAGYGISAFIVPTAEQAGKFWCETSPYWDHGNWILGKIEYRTTGTDPEHPTIDIYCAYPDGTLNGNQYTSNWVKRCQSSFTGLAINCSDAADKPPKQCKGCDCKESPCFGNPVSFPSKEKIQVEEDYFSSHGLSFVRLYSSLSSFSGNDGMQQGWRHTYSKKLISTKIQTSVDSSNPKSLLAFNHYIFGVHGWTPYFWGQKPASQEFTYVMRSDGYSYYFISTDGGQTWGSDSDVNDKLFASQIDGTGKILEWQFVTESSDTELYDQFGRLKSVQFRNGRTQAFQYSDATTPTTVAPWSDLLISITDNFGRTLRFHYDDRGRLARMITPGGEEYLYTYDARNNLIGVTFPDGLRKQYIYNEPVNSPATYAGSNFYLTGIANEIAPGHWARYATFKYDSNGRPISTEHVGGVDKFVFDYTSNKVTDPLQTTRTFTYTKVNGAAAQSAVSQPAGAGSQAASSTTNYDANGNVSKRVDFVGNMSCYAYDLNRNLETVRIDGLPGSLSCSTILSATALPTPARRISTQWHPTYRLPVKIAEPQRLTTNTYDDHGNLLQKTVQATTDVNGAQGFAATITGTPRSWSYTYNAVGQILTTTDPLGAVTTNTYDSQGNLIIITNAAGHVTTLSDYDPNGRVGKITDPNGLVTTLTYSPRGWLTSRTVGGDTTRYDYDGVGQLKKVTLPDTTTIDYTHDDAHRLTGMSDSAGNRIAYTLDAMGNRIKEEVIDPDGVLTGKVTRVYDALNRLQQITGGVQ